MKRVHFLFLSFVVLCLIAIVVIAFIVSKPPSSSSNLLYALNALSPAVNKFALNFYRTVADSQMEQNLIYSPLSLSTAFAMLLLGARGETQKQLFDRLSYNESLKRAKDVHKAFDILLDAIDSSSESNYSMFIANRLFIQVHFEIKPSFKKYIKKSFKTSIESVDFATKNIAQRINEWVAFKTQKKIENLFKEPFEAETKFVVVNAIYFHAKWLNAFDKDNTYDEPFYSEPGQAINVPFMHYTGEFKFFNDTEKKFSLIEIKYATNVSLFVILPNVRYDLHTLMSNLTLEDIEYAINATENRQMRLALPKFKFESEYDLKKTMEKMGVTSIFEKSADFTGLSPSSLAVTKAIHKAVIEVNEEGTEAAGSTGFVLEGRSNRITPSFQANHPFLFIIRNIETKMIYFMGRVKHF
ncbi:serpin B3-like protein [Dinothrombium tinctorium]|uniref:Serpin B3-like protein n=1 Tax=Dinothrombium tinctorium TaxID=1965070 RepID=A0A443R7E1_9ACAR|nr:serpin B3-like protein [Dinothrombium tinctorium]